MGAPELLHHLRCAGLVLTVTPAGGLHVAPRTALTDAHRAAIRAERDTLVRALKAEAAGSLPRRSGNPLLTPEQGDECHAGGWDDAEIDVFTVRQARFTRMGRAADAEHLAERLTLRDRQDDDRRLCLECAALSDNGQCLVAARGRMPGAALRFGPVPTVLWRCTGFTPSPGLI